MRLAYLLFLCFSIINASFLSSDQRHEQHHLSTMQLLPDQKPDLVKPLSGLSYLYHLTQPWLAVFDEPIDRNDTTTHTNRKNDSVIVTVNDSLTLASKNNNNNNIHNGATVDVTRHNGPATAFALLLVFCTLTF